MFYCEYCETFKNTYFEKHPQTVATVIFQNYFQLLYILLSFNCVCFDLLYFFTFYVGDHFNMKIKGSFGNLGISISASASALTSALALALQKPYFVLRSLYFCLSKFYMKKVSMVKYFSSTLADLRGSFSRCLEQLFCRKPVRACF